MYIPGSMPTYTLALAPLMYIPATNHFGAGINGKIARSTGVKMSSRKIEGGQKSILNSEPFTLVMYKSCISIPGVRQTTLLVWILFIPGERFSYRMETLGKESSGF